ncbi:L-rhamnose mutarotase [Hymenobacter terrigena]
MALQDNPQLIEQYKKVHAPGAVWPAVTQGMKEVGILDMEIYFFKNHLFMIMDTVVDFDHEQAMQALALKPQQSEWEAFVSQFQKADATNSAAEKWELVERIYVLDK